jgi:hypothetical protein
LRRDDRRKPRGRYAGSPGESSLVKDAPPRFPGRPARRVKHDRSCNLRRCQRLAGGNLPLEHGAIGFGCIVGLGAARGNPRSKKGERRAEIQYQERHFEPRGEGAKRFALAAPEERGVTTTG